MKTFYPSIIGSYELHTATSRICTIITDNISDDPFIDLVLPSVDLHLRALLKALSRTKDSSIEELLDNKSVELNRRYISLRDFSKAFLTDNDENISTAAQKVVEVIRGLGWSMHLEGNVNRSATIDVLIKRLQRAPLSDAIITLGATSRLNELNEALQDYEATYKEKISAKALEIYPKVYDCRRHLSRYLLSVLNYIDIKDELTGGQFSIAANKLDEVITETLAIARSSRTRKRKEKKNGNGEDGLMS